MDYSRIRLYPLSPSRRKPRIGEMSDLDIHKITVIAEIQKRSVAGIMAQAVKAYIDSTWPKILPDMEALASTRGQTVEALFEDLASVLEDKPKAEPEPKAKTKAPAKARAKTKPQDGL